MEPTTSERQGFFDRLRRRGAYAPPQADPAPPPPPAAEGSTPTSPVKALADMLGAPPLQDGAAAGGGAGLHPPLLPPAEADAGEHFVFPPATNLAPARSSELGADDDASVSDSSSVFMMAAAGTPAGQVG